MTLENVIAIFSVIATVALAVAGFLINRRWRLSDQQRQSHQREAEARTAITAVLNDLTTDEVEEARNLVGTLRYGSFDEEEPSKCDVTRACYRLIWAVERTAAASIAVERLDHTVVLDARTKQLQWHLSEIIYNVELLSAALVIDDEEATARRAEVVDQLDVWGGVGGTDFRLACNGEEFQSDLAELEAVLVALAIPIRASSVSKAK